MIKYFSAFTGIGGFDLGIERAIPDAECIGISEVDKHAIKIYEKHYPDRVNFGDIRKIKTKDLPDFDLFCGGFPCQTFSIAGKRAGLCGERGSLFFEIIRIVRKKQPRYILLENVKGLLSSNKGWDFARILVELGDAGYSVEWAVYNSKNFGVPQNRQRVFIVGHLGRECGSKIFPIGEGTGNFNESGEQPERELVSNAIDSNYYKGPDGKRQLIAIGHTRDKSGKASYHHLEIFGTLKQPSGNQTNYVICDSGFSRKTQVRTEVMPPLRANTGAAYNNTVVTKATGVNCTSKGIEPRKDGFAATIKPQNGNQCPTAIINQKIRRLTPLECERLQGFPELESSIYVQIHNNCICLDLQKSYVNAEIQNHKLPRPVGSAENEESPEYVSFVGTKLNTKNPQKDKPAPKNVHINCVENVVEVHSQGKSYSYVDFVENQNSYLQHIKTEDFVQMIVGINSIYEKITKHGKEELLQNELYSIHLKNGKLFVRLSGNGIMQLVEDVKTTTITPSELLKSITLNRLNIKNIDLNLITSFCYVISAIIGCIQAKISIGTLLNLEIKSRFGWTFGISDTQRYRCLGNAVTVPVIEAVMAAIREKGGL